MQRRNVTNSNSISNNNNNNNNGGSSVGVGQEQQQQQQSLATTTTSLSSSNEGLAALLQTVGVGGAHNNTATSSSSNNNATTSSSSTTVVGNPHHKRTNSRDKILSHDTTTSRIRFWNIIRTIVCSNTCLLCIAIFLTILSYMISPNDYETLELDAIKAEQEFMNYVKSKQQQQQPIMNHPDYMDHISYDNESNMQQQQQPESSSFSWVEGEKKLKKELQKLVVLQQNGKELGVPVLTRWLGDDIPVYASSSNINNIDEWKQKVQDAYEQMRIQEEEWKRTIRNKIK